VDFLDALRKELKQLEKSIDRLDGESARDIVRRVLHECDQLWVAHMKGPWGDQYDKGAEMATMRIIETIEDQVEEIARKEKGHD